LVDGDKGNFAHSVEKTKNPWFKLTFKAPVEIDEVRVFNRKGYESRFKEGVIEFLQGNKVVASVKADGAPLKSIKSSVAPSNGSQIAALKHKLLEEKMDLVTLSVVEHLLSYSLGRELSYLDEDDIHELVNSAVKNGYGFRDIVKSIIKHDIFRRL